MLGTLSVVLAASLPLAASQEEIAMKPFEVSWAPDTGTLLDLSWLLERPAGKHGHIRVQDGHLVDGRGRRLRLWGVNLTGAACFPEKPDAPRVAEQIARFGINCIRFHFLDSNWGEGASLFPPDGDTTRRLDPAQLDRLDFFLAELKKRGVHSNFNLNVGRVYRAGDGVADHECLGLGKALQYFDDHIASLHREYAKQLLTHRNPYTGNRYLEEPALAIVELVNENSIVESWFSGRLRGKQTRKHPGTWCDITAHYAHLLDRKFNAWLAARYPAETLRAWREEAGQEPDAPLPRLQPDQFAKASKSRFAAEATFYLELERRYFETMARFLRQLGLKALLVATSDHNHWRSGYPLVASTSRLDIVDGHVYWQHPRYIRDPSGKRKGFWIANSPMVNDPLDSTVVQLARTPVAGKPYTVSEVNHPFPSEYACEGIPILAAYALLQDWDGIFFYTLEHSDPSEWRRRGLGHFDLANDPVKMSQIAACAMMFHRGDVAPARKTILRSYSPQQVVESLRMPTRERPLYTPGFSRVIPLVHSTRVASFERAKRSYPKVEVPEPIVSDTGQLTWRRRGKRGVVAVATERTHALVGFLGGGRKTTGTLSVELTPDFCAVVITSLDGQPLEQSGKMLLTAGARVATTGMRRTPDRHSLASWGRRPVRIEPVSGTVRLRRAPAAPPLEVVPLDGSGAPLAKPQPAENQNQAATFNLAATTVWYLVQATNPR